MFSNKCVKEGCDEDGYSFHHSVPGMHVSFMSMCFKHRMETIEKMNENYAKRWLKAKNEAKDI